MAAGTPGDRDGFVQPRDREGRFENLDRRGPTRSLLDILRWRFGARTRAPDRAPVPAVAPDVARIATPPARGGGARITWIGHASALVQLEGESFLLDPILGDVWPGVIHRNVAPGVALAELPPIDAVLVTHDHYDHLDVPTLRALSRRNGGATRPLHVVAGLGTRRLLRRSGLSVTEMGWWSEARLGDVTVTFVPAQHFARRGLGDQNRRLWGGFVLSGRSATVYHAGDTASFEGFRQIAARFPRIDAALVPIGAYDPPWIMEEVHLSPERALAAFHDLGARILVPIHWGTFKLADEPLDEPPRRLEAERIRTGIAPERVRVLAVGESLDVPPAAQGPGGRPARRAP
jgi:L-ascorbate metabolism protein UlaG (beta-lactamase superfamily)